MSKSVMLSIQPKWCELIASGKKTIEVRKSVPKLETPFKCYIYCTKAKEVVDIGKTFSWGKEVIGEFVCDKVVRYYPVSLLTNTGVKHIYILCDGELKETCLSYDEITTYGKGKTLYGWHISDLKIYDKPKELSEFYRECPQSHSSYEDGCCAEMCVFYEKGECEQFCLPITKAPQSWGYCEELEK